MGQTTDLIHNINLIDGIDRKGLKGELTFMDLGIAYQQRVRDRMAAYIKLDIAARVGTELQSILTQGINTTFSFDIGWHIKLFEKEKYDVSTIIAIQNQQGSFISVFKFVKDIIDQHPNPSITKNIPILSGATGLRFAYGFNDFIGFKASADLIYGESYTRGENEFSYTAGGGIDLNFYPEYAVPLGFVFNYSISTIPQLVYFSDKPAQIFHGKIAFTRASDFSLGIEYSYQKVPLYNQDKPASVNSVALAARYYF